MECLPLCFLMYNRNVVQPHLLGTEPSEHSNALLRNMQREFTLKDFILIIKKLWRQWRAVMKGGLRLARDSGGYAAGLALSSASAGGHWPKASNASLEGGPVKVGTSPLLPSISSQICKELEITLTTSAANMKEMLRDVCGVKEFHPMIEPFDKQDSIKDLITRCENMLHNTDNVLFKKEATTIATCEPIDGEDIEEGMELPTMEMLVRERNNALEALINEKTAPKQDSNEDENEDQDEDGSEIKIDTDTKIGAEIVKDANSIYNSFIGVVIQRGIKALGRIDLVDQDGNAISLEDSNLIVKAMNMMKMKNRERGAVSGVCKFKSLKERWYEKKLIFHKSEKETGVERGSIISLTGASGLVLVFVVFKELSKKGKLFPSIKGDNVDWPLDMSQARAYRLGVRKVVLTDDDVGVKYMKYHSAGGIDDSDDIVQDGKNVHSIYGLMKDLSSISHLK